MSIATELAKLQTARNKIRTKLVALGLVAAAAKLDDCATAVDGISNQGAVSATVQEGDTYTIPAGYHNGSGTVSGVEASSALSAESSACTGSVTGASCTTDGVVVSASGAAEPGTAVVPQAVSRHRVSTAAHSRFITILLHVFIVTGHFCP